MDLLRHVSYVVAVVDEGSFTDAAYELGITQPPLSQGVRRLERRWGVQLFERGPKGVTLTPAGRRLLPAMRALVDDAGRLEVQAAELAAGEAEVTLGVDEALAGWGPPLLAGLRSRRNHPLRPVVEGTLELVDGVHDGRVDLALVLHPCVTDGLVAGAVHVLPTVLALPADPRDGTVHPVPRDLPLALPARRDSPAAHDQLRSEARRLGHTGEVIQPPATERTAWVSAGRAWTLLPAPTTPSDPPNGVRLVPAPDRLHLHARWVARSEEAPVLEAEEVVAALVTRDGAA